MVRDAPEVLVKNLVRDEWDASNVLGITPYTHHGWVESSLDGETSSDAYFEVAVDDPDESPVNGGQTGFSGTDGAGRGPVQEMAGEVYVRCFAQRGRVGQDGNGEDANPRQAARLMRDEVERILDAHYDGTDAEGEPTDLEYLAWGGAARRKDAEREPTLWWFECLATFGYKKDRN